VHYVIHVIFNDAASATGRVRIWCGLNVGPSVMNTLFATLSPRLRIFFPCPSSRELFENRVSMAIYVRGTYCQTQLFYWLIIGRFTATCFGPIPGPSSGCFTNLE